jgi:hypothetical protein
MSAAIRLSVNGLILAMLVFATTGCARRAPGSSESTPIASRSSAITAWLDEDHSSIGVVALGSDQFLYQDWFEFEPAFKEHFARGPTYTTVRPKRLKRTQVALGDAFHETAESYFSSLPYAGEAAGYGLLLAPALIMVGTLSRTAIGRFEWVQPRPVVQLLDGVDSPVSSIPTGLLNKQSLAMAISDRIIRSSQNRSDPQLLEVPFAQARERSLWIARVDALLTVRVQSIDLIADDSDDPRAVLFIHLWTNFNRLVSRPIEYTSSRLKLSVWTASNARRLREEIDHAAESIAAQIMGNLFPAT